MNICSKHGTPLVGTGFCPGCHPSEALEWALTKVAELERKLQSLTPNGMHPHTEWLMRMQEQSRLRVRQLGFEPNQLQMAYRAIPPLYDRKFTEAAIVDALVEQGGIPAWTGDGVGCVAQMIDAHAHRADRAEARVRELEDERDAN